MNHRRTIRIIGALAQCCGLQPGALAWLRSKWRALAWLLGAIGAEGPLNAGIQATSYLQKNSHVNRAGRKKTRAQN